MKAKKKKVARKKSLPKKKVISKSKPSRKSSKPRKKIVKKTAKKKSVVKKKAVRKKSSKKKVAERISTGIPNFDKLIEKGFERESINLVAGGSGSGKSIFAFQFLLEGIRKGEKTLYVTFEEEKEGFYKNMKDFGWDLEKMEAEGKFIFLEYSPEKVKMMLDEGGGEIETVILKNEVKRMVIDSITSFSLLFEDKLSRRQSTLGLFDMIRKWECTTLLTVQYNPSEKEKEISSIEFEADSIIFLYYINLGSERKRYIEVLKMRGTNHSKEVHSLEISKKGIKVGKKTRIKKGALRN